MKGGYIICADCEQQRDSDGDGWEWSGDDAVCDCCAMRRKDEELTEAARV